MRDSATLPSVAEVGQQCDDWLARTPQEDREREMSDPEYARLYRIATAEADAEIDHWRDAVATRSERVRIALLSLQEGVHGDR